jgi:hypothetical protein
MYEKFLLESLKSGDHHLGIDGRIILKWILTDQHGVPCNEHYATAIHCCGVM